MKTNVEDYANWLASTYIKAPEYSHLIEYMLHYPFIYTVKNDINRSYDGLDLRKHYIMEAQTLPFGESYQCCTFAEFLCALSDRIDFVFYTPDYGHRPAAYFKMMLKNLHIDWATDDTLANPGKIPMKDFATAEQVTDLFRDAISSAIDRINDRSYDFNGQGGLFPLRYADEDQRLVETWIQLAAYIAENKEQMRVLEN